MANYLLISLLFFLQTYTSTCSVKYWVLNFLQVGDGRMCNGNTAEAPQLYSQTCTENPSMFLQVPIAGGVTLYEAISLYKGKRTIASRGKEITHWKIHQLVLYCLCGILAGMVGGLLGLGGGFILGPLFLELGIPPQVASATSTFAMSFSSSMSVVQYYILKRFPVPYGTYVNDKLVIQSTIHS